MIYELRAYIGKAKTLYSAIFTSMEAAKADAARIRKDAESNGLNVSGLIMPLLPANERFEPVLSGCEHL